ncbi:PH domain-containing protein [Nakamurella aerolata]|uniref:PH domain-containing protein n=1 Tax=Nakamurella aerolata TaxID=1656892 RepID=A0A849A9D7_9ACTN|nr:PH domain-containing protein [Nakamurella aerolata]NNG35708.1 PH domain-containing protein [Nakamurella aerolata]
MNTDKSGHAENTDIEVPTRAASTDGWALRPPREPVDRRCLPWWSCQLVVAAAVVVLMLLGAAWFIPAARAWLLPAAAVAAVLAIPAVIVVPRVLMRVHRWEVTDEAVFTRTGLLWQQWRAAPLSRVQTVDTDRGPLQRLFRLATVTVTTASAKGPVRIEALDWARAEELAHRLTRLTEQRPAADDAAAGAAGSAASSAVAADGPGMAGPGDDRDGT